MQREHSRDLSEATAQVRGAGPGLSIKMKEHTAVWSKTQHLVLSWVSRHTSSRSHFPSPHKMNWWRKAINTILFTFGQLLSSLALTEWDIFATSDVTESFQPKAEFLKGPLSSHSPGDLMKQAVPTCQSTLWVHPAWIVFLCPPWKGDTHTTTIFWVKWLKRFGLECAKDQSPGQVTGQRNSVLELRTEQHLPLGTIATGHVSQEGSPSGQELERKGTAWAGCHQVLLSGGWAFYFPGWKAELWARTSAIIRRDEESVSTGHHMQLQWQ
jgi:hypothetical protein